MHHTVLDFGAREITREMVEGQMVLEVGSLNVNGSLRPQVEQFHPRMYLGIDVEYGPGVDVIEDWCHPLPPFWGGSAGCQLLICTGTLEHAHNWRQMVRNIKAAIAPGGWLILTVPSVGFARHHEPDYWRFSVQQIGWIFRDFHISVLTKDPGEADRPFPRPGVMLKAQKPEDWQESDLRRIVDSDLTGIEVFSMEGQE